MHKDQFGEFVCGYWGLKHVCLKTDNNNNLLIDKRKDVINMFKSQVKL